MEIALTPEQEARLIEIAEHEGKSPSQFVVDSVLTTGFDDCWDNEQVREVIRQRIAEADAGIFIEEEEMDARVRRMLQA